MQFLRVFVPGLAAAISMFGGQRAASMTMRPPRAEEGSRVLTGWQVSCHEHPSEN